MNSKKIYVCSVTLIILSILTMFFALLFQSFEKPVVDLKKDNNCIVKLTSFEVVSDGFLDYDTKISGELKNLTNDTLEISLQFHLKTEVLELPGVLVYDLTLKPQEKKLLKLNFKTSDNYEVIEDLQASINGGSYFSVLHIKDLIPLSVLTCSFLSVSSAFFLLFIIMFFYDKRNENKREMIGKKT